MIVSIASTLKDLAGLVALALGAQLAAMTLLIGAEDRPAWLALGTALAAVSAIEASIGLLLRTRRLVSLAAAVGGIGLSVSLAGSLWTG